MTFAEAVSSLEATESKERALMVAYDILTTKYYGNRLKTFTRLFDLFRTDADSLWAQNGFLHCTNLNILLRELLIHSGKFTDEDIQKKWTQIRYLSPHQYVRVRVGSEKWINVDVWAKTYGTKFGDYAHGFKK